MKETNKNSARKRKAENPEHMRNIKKKAVRKRKASNPQLIKEININSPKRLKTVTNLHTTTSSGLNETPPHELPTSSQLICSSGNLQPQINKCDAISTMINLCRKKNACGPEYVCSCCDQLWYKCSVVKCDANKYKACSPGIVKSSLLVLKVLMTLNGFA